MSCVRAEASSTPIEFDRAFGRLGNRNLTQYTVSSTKGIQPVSRNASPGSRIIPFPMSETVRVDASSQLERAEALQEILAHRVLVLDGATGTWFQGQNLTAEDFGGEQYEGCNEHLVLTRPDVVLRLHTAYLEAGADMVETNTFGSTPLVLAEYGLADKAFEISKRAAELAREAAARFSTRERPRFVAGSMGPTTKAITVTGGVTFDELIGHFRTQAAGLLAGGADVLLLETTQDTRNLKAGLIGVQEAFGEIGWSVPIMVSVTIEPMGTMLAGQAIDGSPARRSTLSMPRSRTCRCCLSA